MRCILSESSDTYFNLASEEYLLKCFQEDVFLLYRNRPSLVVGKHQNTLAEVNLAFVKENEIIVARRISGGGTVFHDLGNLNFAFITRGKEGDLVDYRRFTLPIIEALADLGLDVRLGDRNQLLLGDLKISGTASHVFKQRVLHHGTLLFSTEMENLSKALKAQSEWFKDRAVKSVKSDITNVRDHLDQNMHIGEFQNRIYSHILKSAAGNYSYTYSDHDLKEIHKLRESKFSTWEWNFGYSPKYTFEKSMKLTSGSIHIQLMVKKGIIQEVGIKGDFMSNKGIQMLQDALTGGLHDPESLRIRLSGIRVSDHVTGLGNEELLSGLF